MKRTLLFTILTLYLAYVAYSLVFKKSDREARYDQKFFFQEKTLSALQIKTSNQVVHLEKKGEDWWVTSPVNYPADDEFIERSLQVISKVKVDNIFKMKADDYYGFGSDQPEVSFIDQSGEVKRFVIGREEAPQNRMYLLNKETQEVLVVHNIWGQFTYYPLNMFLAKKLPLKGATIRKVEMSMKGEPLWSVLAESKSDARLHWKNQQYPLAKAKFLWMFKQMNEIDFQDVQTLVQAPTDLETELLIETDQGIQTFLFDEKNSTVYIPNLGVRGRYSPEKLSLVTSELEKVVPRD